MKVFKIAKKKLVRTGLLYSVQCTKLDEYDRVKCEHNDNSKKRQLQEPSELSYTKKIKQSSLVQLSIEKSTTISHVETDKFLLTFLINTMTPISIVNNKDFKEYVRGNYLNLSYKFILSNMIFYIYIYLIFFTIVDRDQLLTIVDHFTRSFSNDRRSSIILLDHFQTIVDRDQDHDRNRDRRS